MAIPVSGIEAPFIAGDARYAGPVEPRDKRGRIYVLRTRAGMGQHSAVVADTELLGAGCPQPENPPQEAPKAKWSLIAAADGLLAQHPRS